MRPIGLRPRLLLLLGGLLAFAFVPLVFALATYTRVTLRQLDDTQARALGRTLAALLREAEPRRSAAELLADAPGLVAALAPRAGPGLAALGDPAVLAELGRLEAGALLLPRVLSMGGRRLWVLAVSTAEGTSLLALDAERASSRAPALLGMFGLYAFAVAVGLLTFTYFGLTRLIVRPLEELSLAAESVTLGGRALGVPRSGVRELGELGKSLERMTDRLLGEEVTLRAKIDELERARSELASAQSQLVRSERLASVGRLAAGLGHEIGNPIAAMMGLLDLMLDAELERDQERDFLRRLRAETERVHRTLKSLLAFARPAREAAAAPGAGGDVEAAIHDTTALVMHQDSMRDLELHIDVYPGLPKVTLGSEQLGQVLLNLLLNARDALAGRPQGRILVSAQAADDGVRIAVEDTGGGVAPEIAEHIFEPFFTTKDVGEGTGLGLSVCQGLVSAAGGSLALDLAHRGGARFVLLLPRAEQEPPQSAQPA